MARTLTIVAVFFVALCSSVFFWVSLSDFSVGNFTTFAEIAERNKVETSDSLYFVGDIMLGRNVERLMDKKGLSYPLNNITFATSSIVVGNFEAVVPKTHQPTPDFKMAFSVPTTSLMALKEAGFTHMSLANNHSYDFGAAEYINTKEELATAGLIAVGDQNESATSSLFFVNVDNEEIAIVFIYAVDREPDNQALEEIFTEAEKAEQQIVFVHWGSEYKYRPNSSQEDLVAELVELGADFIIGHHPHVVQSVDMVGGVPVFYSLGNFIFDQYFSDSVQEGLVLKLDYEDGGWQVQLLPVTSIGSLSQPRYMTSQEKSKFLAKLAKNSEEDIREYILAGSIMVHEYAK